MFWNSKEIAGVLNWLEIISEQMRALIELNERNGWVVSTHSTYPEDVSKNEEETNI